MNIPGLHDEEDDHGEVFLDEADIIHEVSVDEEGLSFLLLIFCAYVFLLSLLY